ncbi:hypothetical protein COHA_006825 [Chlorella ohadii]|uniref:Uncharacterized protein n=1 Tax=Chlorella ohadii TaxID=2649997 RepID=A0AAD5DN91_9CHLO|nr:hypothetical protein COHA_006825 [Chlorella ohadii]
MLQTLSYKSMVLDRAVMLLVVATNVAVLAHLSLQWSTFIGVLNGSLAAALLWCSFRRPATYAQHRLWPVLVMRTLICVLPFASDTVGLFPPPENFTPARQASWGLFMLLLGISWTIGPFVATFLLLPPVHHLMVQIPALVALMRRNRSVCAAFLAQHPSNAGIIDSIGSVLHAAVASVAPAAPFGPAEALGLQASQQAVCMASSAAVQVSLGLVLPTLLAWHLQSRMAASIAAHAEARQDSSMLRQHTKLCGAVATATQEFGVKALLTLSSMTLTYVVALLALA